MKKNILAFFRRLQWKLTISYTIVTIGTVIVLALLLVGIAMYTESQVSARVFSSFYWSKTAFQDNIPYLIEKPSELQAWLERIQQQGFAWTDFQSYTVREALDYANTLVTRSQPIYVLDPDLKLIAAAPLTDSSEIGQPFKTRRPNGLGFETILDAAMIGNKNYTAQSYILPDGNYIVAFPLRKTDDDPVVAIVIYTLKPIQFATPINLSIYTTFFVVLSVVMLIVTLPLGSVFGWLASRGLRKRLANLSLAAKAWSKGDFSPAPRDKSADEIGELTRDLVYMAEQLQTHLHTRDELARVEERNRLARDLHDTVKQQTYAARMQLSAAKNLLITDPASAAEHLEAALQLNRETQQELKLIIDELRPAALQGRGLAQALLDYVSRWQEHTGIKVEIVTTGERPLPLEVEQALYRVSQEALSNIARHAEADAVQLTLNMTLEQVTLLIADNGHGFDPAAVLPHALGLKGMKQRIDEIGGTIRVESRPATGTTITVVIPKSVE